MWWLRGLIVAGVLGGLAILAGGVVDLVQDETGTRVVATVTKCNGLDTTSTHETCTGHWVVGESISGKAHVVVGDISGAHDDDIGKTLHATARGNTAYTRGLLLPILLMGIGVVLGGGTGLLGVVVWSP